MRLDLLPSAIGIPIALGAAFVGPYAGSDEGAAFFFFFFFFFFATSMLC